MQEHTIIKPAEPMTRLVICAVVAAAAVYAAERLCQGKDWPLWVKYGPWIQENRIQAIAILAAVFYGASLALWPEEKAPATEKDGPDGFEACP